MIRVAVLFWFVSACGRDIYLGERVTPDASVDAAGNGNPFSAGTYSVQFLDPLTVDCIGTLGGHEADFDVVTRGSLGVIDGTVVLATPDGASLTVAGTPIMNRFAQSTLTLLPDNSSTPPVWDGEVDGSFDAGPDSTTCEAIALAADPATAAFPTGVQGAIAFLFVTSDTNGDCSLTFRALFTKS